MSCCDPSLNIAQPFYSGVAFFLFVARAVVLYMTHKCSFESITYVGGVHLLTLDPTNSEADGVGCSFSSVASRSCTMAMAIIQLCFHVASQKPPLTTADSATIS